MNRILNSGGHSVKKNVSTNIFGLFFVCPKNVLLLSWRDIRWWLMSCSFHAKRHLSGVDSCIMHVLARSRKAELIVGNIFVHFIQMSHSYCETFDISRLADWPTIEFIVRHEWLMYVLDIFQHSARYLSASVTIVNSPTLLGAKGTTMRFFACWLFF